MGEGHNLGLLCFYPYRAMEARVMQALAEAGHDDITVAQSRIFQRLAPEGSRLVDLAEQSGVTKQTAKFLVDQLVRAGYVERAANPRDARSRLVRLAPRGRELILVARAAERAVEGEWAALLGPRETERLRRTLERLREVTDPYA